MGTITAQPLFLGSQEYPCLAYEYEMKDFDALAYFRPDSVAMFYFTPALARSPLLTQTLRLWEIYYSFQLAKNPNPPALLEVRFRGGQVVESEIVGLETSPAALVALALFNEQFPPAPVEMSLAIVK